MNQGEKQANYTRRSALKTLGSVAGVAAVPGLASATDAEVIRTIDINTSGYDRVDEAKVRFFSNGAVEHFLSGHRPAGASPEAFAMKTTETAKPERAEATLLKESPDEMPTAFEDDPGTQTASGSTQNDVGTMGHSGGNDDSDGDAYLKVLCEKKDSCYCWPEWELYSKQSSDWNDDDGDGCIVDGENLWAWKWAINGDACYSWNHKDGNIWEDDGTCSLDQIREDRFTYDGGDNKIVIRHQLTLHADGSNDWEVTRYDDGGNGCLYHKVETG